MPVFRYLCIDQTGHSVKGEIEAADIQESRFILRNKNLFPVEIRPAEERVGKRFLFKYNARPDPREKTAAIRQLASLISSHIPVVEAVETVASQIKNPILYRAFHNLSEALGRGISFSEALRREKVFPETLAELVSASEASGTLGKTLSEFARSQEALFTFRCRITNSLVYPLFLAGVSLGVLVFLFLIVLPKVSAVFAESGVPLPAFTKFVLAQVMVLKNLSIFLAFLLLFLYLTWWSKGGGKKGKDYLWRIVHHLPFATELFRKHSLALFARNLSALHQGGVKLIESMHLVEKVLPDPLFRAEIRRVTDDLTKGVSISQALEKSLLFPPFVIQMVRVGEETGDLTEMLEKVARHYEEELESGLTRIVALLEPVMVMVMGLVVGSIVVSVLLPIFEMSRIIR